jgi:hypothetical protein
MVQGNTYIDTQEKPSTPATVLASPAHRQIAK